MLRKKFVAPALPIPNVEYDQREQTDLIRALRLYFNLLDDYLNQLTTEVNGYMEPFSATSLDAFGRLRIAQPYTLFDSQNRYQKDPQFSEELVTGGTATYVANESSVDLNVTTSSGSKAVRQSFRSFPYQPGKSLMVLATFVMNEGKENLRQRVGYFNTSNGVFFQVNGTTKSFVLRTNTSGTPSDVRTVNQAEWNGDKLDGTGASGITLDITKAQILYMDFEWLGVGSVRCGFVINGTFYVCHTFNNANDIDKVYMTTAILPVRYEIENTAATASASTMTQICSSVISEGGYDQKATPQWARRTTTLTGVGSAAFVPIVSIRLKNTSLGAVVIPSVFHAIPIGSTLDYEVVLIKNPTLTGPSWVSNSTNVEMDVTATALTGGSIVDLDYVSGSNQGSGVVSEGSDYNFDLQLGASISGTSDIYTLAARTISGTDDIIGSMSYYDLTD
jgi:hypothetical protein